MWATRSVVQAAVESVGNSTSYPSESIVAAYPQPRLAADFESLNKLRVYSPGMSLGKYSQRCLPREGSYSSRCPVLGCLPI